MNKKNKLISLLASIGCVALSAGVGAQFTTVQAEGKTIGNVDVSSFRMSYGAEIRFNPDDTTDPIGIRFAATLADQAYEELEKLDGVNYGMIIVPSDIVKNKPLTEENLFGQEALYCLADPKQGEETEGCTCTKQHVASVEYAVLSNAKKDDGVRNLRGSLVDILPANLTREYVGLGYIEYNGAYVLADYAYGENDKVSDIKNNTRSVTYVAQRAIDNNQDDADQTLKTTFVDTQSGNQFKYTVNHYLPKEEGGYTTVTETAAGTLGAEVTATHITKGSLAADYKAYKLYGFDTTQGKTESVLYANGRTTLNVYYTPMDTTFPIVKNNADFYLMGAQANLTGATTKWHDTIEMGGETKESVVQISTTAADQYTAGKFRIALTGAGYEQAKANDFAYIKLHMYIDCDDTVSTFNFLSHNQSVASNVQTHQWVDVIVPLAKLNQSGTYLSLGGDYSKASFEAYNAFGKYGYDGGNNDFLTSNSIKTGIGLTTTDVTYYIDDVSWGIDTKEPTITVSGLGEEMFEGTFTEPTVTVTDDLALQSRLDSTVVKTLYKVDGETRTPVELTDGKVDLTKGSYVYVVAADDRIYSDVVGNVATKEVAFEVIEKQDIVITFDSADDVSYIQKNSAKTYYAETTYLTADELAAEGLNAGAIAPEGGALKFVAGMEGSTDANGTGGAQKYGAWLSLGLSEDEIALVSDATAITFRLYVHPSSYPNWSGTEGYGNGHQVQFLDGNNQSNVVAGFDRDTWVDVTIDVATFTANWSKYLDGTQSLFWTSTNTMYSNTGTITYYINSITFDVTP